MNTVRVRRDGSVSLPRAVTRRMPAASTLAVWTEGDTIILKRMKPVSASEIARRRPDRGPSLKSVASEIHRMRRERRGRRG